MKVIELYDFLNSRIPSSLSCEWDNDGLMCCPDKDLEVKKVLVTLDVTAEAVECAKAESCEVILAHHPLIFKGLKAIDGEDNVSAKVIDLIKSGIAVMSFHTRLDALCGGVNDILAEKLGLLNVAPFGENGETIGRIGKLSQPIDLDKFAQAVKDALGAPCVTYADAGKEVSAVAVLGGSGGDDISAAMAAGADTFVSGELKYHALTDAPECGMNLIVAGHFHTEFPVCNKLCELVAEASLDIERILFDSNRIKTI